MTSVNRRAPGVYLAEGTAFPPSVVGVATAVPIFVGYTETAANPASGKPIYLEAVPIASMTAFLDVFGHGFSPQGLVARQPVDGTGAAVGNFDFQAASATAPHRAGTPPPPPGPLNPTFAPTDFIVATSKNGGAAPQFTLFAAMLSFYANGGGECFVISVANYWGSQSLAPRPEQDPVPVDAGALLAGLQVAAGTRGGTMLVVPDACLLTAETNGSYTDYRKVVAAMLEQSASLQDRVAILDLPGALDPDTWSRGAMQVQANAFYAAIDGAPTDFSYGVAYAPALQSSLLSAGDLSYVNLTGSGESNIWMNNLLTTQAQLLHPPKDYDAATGAPIYSETMVALAARVAAAFPVPREITTTAVPSTPAEVIALVAPPGPAPGEPPSPRQPIEISLPGTFTAPNDADGVKALDQYLVNAIPLLANVKQVLASKLSVVPPSGIMAGIWALNDAERGVWNAPANCSLNEIIAPKVILTDDQQREYNVPVNGRAIDILRAMINRGTVVWGARTLDGNSLDYRYIQVRRTLIYIDQSIRLALQQFVFAPNDGETWATVIAAISNFLTGVWEAGGLMGDKASDAFSVACGVPTTMSGLDVLSGYMNARVTVQMIHPAEFIELSFTQTMQGV